MLKFYNKPYYAVVFHSIRTSGDNGYGDMANKAVQAAENQEGFLGAESVRGEKGEGITVSYWASMESIEAWKNNALHMAGKQKGVEEWYENYAIRICKVEYDNFFEKSKE